MGELRWLVVGGRRFGVTDHAVERWHERGCPNAPSAQAAFEKLTQMAAVAQVTGEPEWLHDRPEDTVADYERAVEWVVLGDIGFAVVGRNLVTCIARGDISDTARARRREVRRKRAQTRAMIRNTRGDAGPVGRGAARSKARS